MYKLVIRPILFLLNPELSHKIAATFLKVLNKSKLISRFIKWKYTINDKRLQRTVFGITFPNPVGLAAGFDKNGELVDELSNFGFGHIEIGTVTPVPQDGNPKPRLFRLKGDSALINRMGFNNLGSTKISKLLKSRKSKVIVGGNIGKNKLTSNESAISDYERCFNQLNGLVDYFVINVSSPNTPNLRSLQEKEPLKLLVTRIIELSGSSEKQTPILIKIAPDLSNSQLDDIIEIAKETSLSGIIATNTTLSREGLISKSKIETGGLSGRPLNKRSTEVVKYLSSNLSIPIIAVGGIFTKEDAIEKLEAGASLVQIYTGFIYEGPELIKEINKEILKRY